jgi:hypothetical protein
VIRGGSVLGKTEQEAGVPVISRAQQVKLFAHARQFDVSEEELRLYLSVLGFKSTSEIPAAQFNTIMAWVEGRDEDDEPADGPDAEF